jgi:hypothetical protein
MESQKTPAASPRLPGPIRWGLAARILSPAPGLPPSAGPPPEAVGVHGVLALAAHLSRGRWSRSDAA